jgi:hypothetical protein
VHSAPTYTHGHHKWRLQIALCGVSWWRLPAPIDPMRERARDHNCNAVVMPGRQPAAAARRQPAACLPQHCSLRLLVAATVPILPQHRRHARLRGLAPDCGPGQPACVPPCIWYVRGPYSVSPRYLASSRDDQPFDSITAHAAGCARLPRCRHRQIRPSSERTRALPYKSTRC